MHPSWDRTMDVAVVCLLGIGIGLTAYVLWDDWKIRRERTASRAAYENAKHPVVVEDQVVAAAPAEAGG
jgi:hypothetical protein